MSVETLSDTLAGWFPATGATANIALIEDMVLTNIHRELGLRNALVEASSVSERNSVFAALEREQSALQNYIKHRQLILDHGKLEYLQLRHMS